MYNHEHPPAFGAQHPWHDPFAPQDFVNPRPDQDLAFVGPAGPRPEDFPFTEEGRREYYDAVRRSSQQLMQQQHIHHAHAAEAARAQASREADKWRAAFLLLSP